MRNLRLALFIVLVAGTGFATGLLNPPGGWYAALAKPWFKPTELGLCPGLVDRLSAGGNRGLANLGARPQLDGYDAVVGADGAQLPVVAHLLYGALAGCRACRHFDASRRDPGFHRKATVR